MNIVTLGTHEWTNLLSNLDRSRTKSNRDVLCARCWKVFRYMKSKRHVEQNPDHGIFMRTTRMFAEEEKFLEQAYSMNKVVYENGIGRVENPYQAFRSNMPSS